MQFRVLGAVFLVAAVGTSPVYGQAIWAGPSGGGMMAVQEPDTLEPGHFAMGFFVDGYDRDPLGIDVVDIGLCWRLAVVHRLELYSRYQISRSVSVPGTQPAPPPPVDIVVLPGAWVQHPYRPVYWPMPLLGDYPARVDDMIGGEYTLGLKALMVRQRDFRPAVSGSVQISIPGTFAPYELAKGSGSGAVNVGFHGAAGWHIGPFTVAANLGATTLGTIDRRGDRLIIPDHGTIDLPLDRPIMLRFGTGLRYRPSRHVAFMAEFTGWQPVGHRTLTFDDRGATDVLIGIEGNIGPFTLTIGGRWHLWPQTNGLMLPTGPLGGGIDLSALSAPERARYLVAVGAPTEGYRPDANLVVLGTPADMLPGNARLIPALRKTSTTGNDSVVAVISFSP